MTPPEEPVDVVVEIGRSPQRKRQTRRQEMLGGHGILGVEVRVVSR